MRTLSPYHKQTRKVCKVCRKNIYISEMEAQETARYREYEHANVQLRWYPCPQGNGWHLTSG